MNKEMKLILTLLFVAMAVGFMILFLTAVLPNLGNKPAKHSDTPRDTVVVIARELLPNGLSVQEVEIDGCEYLLLKPQSQVVSHNNGEAISLTHKGNCKQCRSWFFLIAG